MENKLSGKSREDMDGVMDEERQTDRQIGVEEEWVGLNTRQRTMCSTMAGCHYCSPPVIGKLVYTSPCSEW